MCNADDKNTASERQKNIDLMPEAGKVHLDPARPWGRGIVAEIKECVLGWWCAEMTNFNQKTIAVSILLFISVVAPTLTFGAVYGRVTNNDIGAIETILATSWVGCTYAIFGGMPMAIIGSTGPILIMTTALKSISDGVGVPFRTFYAWNGVWIAIYGFLAGFFDLTRFVKMATRFTDDAFALLIVSIFIMDAIGDPFSDVGLLRLFDPNHKSHIKFEEEDPDYDWLRSALLSLILGLGTTYVIFWLRSFKFTTYFYVQGLRTSLFDFSVTISVIMWTLIYQLGFASQAKVEGLSVPNTFEPSLQCCDATCTTSFPDDCPEQEEAWGVRPWFADFGELNGKGYVPIMAAGPAILAFMLVFLDNGITWHLINSPANKLVHGVSYNWDLVIVSIMNCVNSMMGLPWLVATTVPCMIHVSALADKDQDGNIKSTQETRLTGLLAHLLLGLVMLFLQVLKLLPLPVLYGVFLFMGIASLDGLQLWDRFLLFFQQPSLYDQKVPYIKYIKNSRIHLYTVVQAFFFGLIFFVQNFDPIKIAFPLMTFLCIPARLFLLPRLFDGWELELLDGHDEEIEHWVSLKEKNAKLKPQNSIFFYLDGGEREDVSDSDGPLQEGSTAGYTKATATSQEGVEIDDIA